MKKSYNNRIDEEWIKKIDDYVDDLKKETGIKSISRADALEKIFEDFFSRREKGEEE
ncbi:MAG: hypothetical protein GY754_18080 [bacterium]|nr:hypothetical protein [bacterium]